MVMEAVALNLETLFEFVKNLFLLARFRLLKYVPPVEHKLERDRYAGQLLSEVESNLDSYSNWEIMSIVSEK